MAGSRLIGIAGAGRGTGVTHLAIWAANYLVSARQRSTAVLEWNEHGDFHRLLQLAAGGRAQTTVPLEAFCLLGADYYPRGDSQTVAYCMDKAYDDIIIDFGELREEIHAEWLRCEKKILTAAMSDWKLEAFLELLAGEEKLGMGWMYMTAFGSETTRRELERQFCIALRRIPLSADAFSVDRRAMDWFLGIFP